MKTTLILPKDGRNILVSDEEITLSDTLKNCCYYFKGEIIKREYSHHSKGKKIIAGIDNLPTLTYSDDVKQELREKYGWVDVEELAKDIYPDTEFTNYILASDKRKLFIEGAKTLQSITNKMFSLEEAEIIFGLGAANNANGEPSFEDVIQSLQQPIQLKVEIEQENKQLYCDVCDDILVLNRRTWNCIRCKTEHIHKVQPKITNNSIKILKITE